MRFSQALNNSGYAVLRVPKVNGGTLLVTGSNLYGNRSGAQVDCGQAGSADHNFFGFGVAASSAATNCAANDTKQLGAPVLPRDNAAGVSGEKVTVTTTRESSFDGLVSYQGAGEGTGYKLNIVNHGAGSPENVPFTGGSSSSLVACSIITISIWKKAKRRSNTNSSGCATPHFRAAPQPCETSAYCTGSDSNRFPACTGTPRPLSTDRWKPPAQPANDHL